MGGDLLLSIWRECSSSPVLIPLPTLFPMGPRLTRDRLKIDGDDVASDDSFLMMER